MLGVNALLNCLVLVGELLGVGDHLLDLLLSEAALIISDRDGLGLADALLDTGDGQDAVFVDLESDLNLGHTAGGGRNTSEIELAQLMVILDHGALSLEDGDRNSSLLVLVGGESLGLLGWDNGTALDDGSHDTSNGLNTESKWGNIDEKKIFITHGLSTEDSTLDGGTVSNGLIRVDTSVRLLAVEEVLDELLDLGDSCRATDENNFVDLAALQTRVVDYGLDGLEGVLEQVVAKLFELGTSEGLLEVDSVDDSFDEDLDLLDG